MRPPNCSTRVCAIESPNPVPWRERARWGGKKRSKGLLQTGRISAVPCAGWGYPGVSFDPFKRDDHTPHPIFPATGGILERIVEQDQPSPPQTLLIASHAHWRNR